MFAAHRFRFLVLLALGLCSLPAAATLMRSLPIEELTQKADLIVHATVTSKTCVRDPEGRIITRVQLEVSEVWKGNLATNSFTVVHGGGKIGNIRSEVSGGVEYIVGEEVVAFLAINSRGEGVTMGLCQGKFNVWKDQGSGEKFAHNIFHGVTEKDAAREERKAERLSLRDLARQAKGAVR